MILIRIESFCLKWGAVEKWANFSRLLDIFNATRFEKKKNTAQFCPCFASFMKENCIVESLILISKLHFNGEFLRKPNLFHDEQTKNA